MYSPDPGSTPTSIPVPPQPAEMARSTRPIETPEKEEPKQPTPSRPTEPRIADVGVQQPQRKPRESELVPGMQ